MYGRQASDGGGGNSRFPARQSLAASQAIARLHQLENRRTLFIGQNPEAIDAGVFHNDVICVGNQNVLLLHEQAFAEGQAAIDQITEAYHQAVGRPLCIVQILSAELSLPDAVNTYLFNSQLVTRPATGQMALIAPAEAREHDGARRCIERIICDPNNPVASVIWADVRQSMQNGGGPACLRIRVVLNEAELAATNPAVFLTDTLNARLTEWILRHYRDQLVLEDLADPDLHREARAALEELGKILSI